MACARGGKREEVSAKRTFRWPSGLPKTLARFPIRSKPFVVRDGILNDQRLDTFRMHQSHAKADRSAVVLHVQRVARYRERLSEPGHDLGIAVERVREFLRIGPIAVAESRVVGRYEVVTIGKAIEQRLEHARRRRQAVKQ